MIGSFSDREISLMRHALSLGPGEIFYCSTGTSKDAIGGEFGTTLSDALDRCVDGRGDTILLHPEYQFEIPSAAFLNLNKAGVTIMASPATGPGGHTERRPQIRLTTATAAHLKISAANITLKDIDFVNEIDALVKVIDVFAGADGLTIDGCRFLNKTLSVEYLVCIQCTDTSLATVDSVDPWTTLTKPEGGFLASMVGKSVFIVSGTNMLAERFTCTGFLGDTAGITLDRLAGDEVGASTDTVIAVSAANHVTIKNCCFNNIAAVQAATECIELAGMTEGWKIHDNVFVGDWSVSVISAITQPSFDLSILRNSFTNEDDGASAGLIDVIAITRGDCAGNWGYHNGGAANTAYDVGDLTLGLNYASGEIAKYGKLIGTEAA